MLEKYLMEIPFQSKILDPTNCHDDDIKPTLWQLHLYPNGDLGARNYNSVSLEAIKTPFERSNNINEREQRHKLGIGKTFVNRSFRSTDIFIQITFIDPDESIERNETLYEKTEKVFEDDELADIEFNFDCDKPVKAHRVI
ncbi:769_t:CDS:2 [Funneliformis mosseae]|uniref:769_t:CDS:1 n=1 Tax=Funneliformis mosseae TaxID=27381 RepID=A0A9N9IFC5_FUNMO|nr:769_t:CDS:2 [Funneliformis mosseae]